SFLKMRKLIQTAKQMKKDKNIRAVILTGNGNCFCSGIDLEDLNSGNNKLKMIWEFIKPGKSIFQKVALVWQEVPVPVISVIEGHCLGAGMQLALASDFRIAYSKTTFSILEGRWGIVPDMGISRTAHNLISQDTLRKYTYTADFFDSNEALENGFVTQVSERALEDAIEFIFKLKTRSPDMLAGAKDILNTMLRNPKKSLRKEKIWQLKLLAGKNQKIAVRKNSDDTQQFSPRQYK
ncbi:MAG: crotonase/enoyl-CoA hydratase family protein, partial [Neisseriaceae bacterium]|nr:crotonase/enoyl-CoA hydratase family protein [Neisseriaceae bacterium]